jgi:protein-S-isoprenylcysteine O-methyltransferase Ste14
MTVRDTLVPRPVLAGALALTLGLLLLAVVMVRRDSRRGDHLSRITVVVVWAAYLVHASVTTGLAWLAPLGALDVPAVPAAMVGGALAGAGIVAMVEAVATFRSFGRMSGRDTSRLVTSGIYGFSRNPQNVGWVLLLLGVAVAGRSVLAAGLVLVFAVVLHTYIVGLEEPYLLRVYGEEYATYMRTTARYLGMPSR